MKTLYKKIKFFLVVLFSLLLFSQVLIINNTIEVADALNAGKEARKEIVFIEKIAEMEYDYLQLHQGESPISLSVSKIKDIHSFSGNKYTLAELEPTGYILYHDDSGVFVEYSATTLSPYLGLFEKLYYAGPKNYYSKDLLGNDEEYKHTIMDRTLSEDDIIAYEDVSNKLNDALMAEKNENIVNYVKNNIPLQKYSALSQLNNSGFPQSVQERGSPIVQSVSYNGMTCVDNYTFFTRLNNCGNNVNGTCGYLAAGMLLAYRQYAYGGNYIPSSYLTWATIGGISYPSLSNQLHLDLVNVGATLGYGYGTTSSEIRDTVDKYLSDNGYPAVTRFAEWIPIANNILIADYIYNNKPMIWFGQITSNSYNSQSGFTHAIVVYGFKFSLFGGYSYISHFGWTNATEVYFTGILGSAYTCWR